MALLIWSGFHHMSALCAHPVGCLWTQWSRMASLSLHSAAYRADLVSGETHKDGMAQTVGTLPHTLGSPQLVGSPCPPPPQVSCALCFVAEEWPQGIFSRVPLGLLESHPPFFFFSFLTILCSLHDLSSPTRDRTQGQQWKHRVLLIRLDKEFPNDREFPSYTLLTSSTQSMKTERPYSIEITPGHH